MNATIAPHRPIPTTRLAPGLRERVGARVGIIAGRLGYPVRRFLVYSIVGKVVQSIAFVYLALWNISLVSSWAGLGP